MRNFVGIREAHAGGELAHRQKLVIGPWQHSPWRAIGVGPREDVGANAIDDWHARLCVVDADCPRDFCATSGHCGITGKPCVVGSDGSDPCQTHPIYCVKYPDRGKTLGFCKVGRNCAPIEGLSCDDVRKQTIP